MKKIFSIISTISFHHNILAKMNSADTGTKDTFFRWYSRLATPNLKDWIFNATPYSGSLNNNLPHSIYTIAYTGGITAAGSAAEDFRYQRPALQMNENGASSSMFI